jgi:DNA mismatch repair protein MutS
LHSIQVQRDDELIALPPATAATWSWSRRCAAKTPTLFSLLDTCMTGMGSRLLKTWLLEPRRDRSHATARLQATQVLRGQGSGTAPGRRCATPSRA